MSDKMFEPICEMCGSDDIGIQFADRVNEGMYSKPERLLCKCKRCEYAFTSKTLKDKESQDDR